MRKGRELNKNIGRKSLHHFVQRLLVRSVRQQVAKPQVPGELFIAGGETALDRMHRICVAIWETGKWPEEWTFSTFIPLTKKGDLKQCENYRTTALVSRFPGS